MNKKRVLFFFENDWAFGQIYNSLTRRLAKYGIYAHILDWRKSYTHQEFEFLMRKFDAIVTEPSAIDSVMSYNIPKSKIIAVAHHEKDIIFGINRCGLGMYDELQAYGVIHEHLVDVSHRAGISRVPLVVPNGIDFDYFYSSISPSLKTLGYAGAASSEMSDFSDFKRSYLLKPISEAAELPLKINNRMYHMCVAGYYETIDSLLVTSKYEGCGLPAMEAAAAGRLVLAAQAGSFDGSSGLLCRLPDEEFIIDAVSHLERCKDPVVYRDNCERAQQYAREHYDWDNVINKYVELLTSYE
jgi:glycosyltransferase involved in cell wall biosynthesis